MSANGVMALYKPISSSDTQLEVCFQRPQWQTHAETACVGWPDEWSEIWSGKEVVTNVCTEVYLYIEVESVKMLRLLQKGVCVTIQKV